MTFELDKAIQWASTRWEKRSTVFILVVCVCFVLLFKFTGSDLDSLTIGEIGLIVLVSFSIFVTWYFTNRLPKAPRGKIGFAVAISAETDEEEKCLASDFIDALRGFAQSQSERTKFHVVVVPAHHARRIGNLEDARRVRRKCRCHFLVYGKGKVRTLNRRQYHVLQLHGQVSHRPVPEEVGKAFQREFSQIFPQNVRIDCENDLLSLEFTSRWIDIVAHYIIGTAALLSGDLDYAETLYETVQTRLANNDGRIPTGKMIRERLPLRLGNIYITRARIAYEQWKTSSENYHLNQMWKHLRKLRQVNPADYAGRLLTAIYLFLVYRDVDSAIAEMRKCRDIKDGTWRYSYAFLLGYAGQMSKARRMYKSAFRYSCGPDVPFQTEEFMLRILRDEQDKVQLYFCLGLVNWHGKGDVRQAYADFKTFLVHDGVNAFLEEKRLAEAYVTQLESEIRLEEESERVGVLVV